MIKALEIPSRVNLADFSAYLRRQGLPHRILEEGTNQVLWVSHEEAVGRVREAFSRFEAGELNIQGMAAGAPRGATGLVAMLLRSPMTLALMLASLCFFPVSFGVEEGDLGYLLSRMTFPAIERQGDLVYFIGLEGTFATGQYWRIFSPMFIHFGVLHLVFNILWVWEIGRRIEFVNGSASMLGIVLSTSAVSTLLQFFLFGPGLFGGMSGVVFGLLGHSFVFSHLVPERTMGVSKAIYVFMLVYLLLGFTGVLDLLGMGSLANGAHLGGLLGGLCTGAMAGFSARSLSRT